MASYGRAKARLFQISSLRTAVLNADDPFAEQTAAGTAAGGGGTALRLGTRGMPMCVSNLCRTQRGHQLRCTVPGEQRRCAVRCWALQRHEPAGCAGAALQAGMPFDAMVAAAATTAAGARAHGAAARAGSAAGGDRLRAYAGCAGAGAGGTASAVSRPPDCGVRLRRRSRSWQARADGRGRVRGADFAVVTSDNPRGEDPGRSSLRSRPRCDGDYRVEVDRGAAIAAAIDLAAPGDCVLIAGKGHEDYQIIGSRRACPFSDSDVATSVPCRGTRHDGGADPRAACRAHRYRLRRALRCRCGGGDRLAPGGARRSVSSLCPANGSTVMTISSSREPGPCAAAVVQRPWKRDPALPAGGRLPRRR
jgi:UDP-N-acetylmuramoyl-L-alanyl-D-glutamate--2,6-diaminopimelate ligase